MVIVRVRRRGCEERGGAGVASRLDTTLVPAQLRLIVLVIIAILTINLVYRNSLLTVIKVRDNVSTLARRRRA